MTSNIRTMIDDALGHILYHLHSPKDIMRVDYRYYLLIIYVIRI